MKTDDFDFNLPVELIAQTPIIKRDESRLLVIDKIAGTVEHKIFKDIINYLEEGDCIVLNNTKVIPARLIGQRKNTGGKVELLLLNQKDSFVWEVLVYPGKKAKVGDCIQFNDGELTAIVLDVLEDGNRLIKFEFEGIFEEILDRLGEMPLPPYITEKLENKERYQTIYAKHKGSAAAPTAGLHFSQDILQQLTDKKVKIANITLHVGLGTFRPVKVDDVLDHKMHSEYYELSQENANIINMAKINNKHIFAVGTTSCRTLESVSNEEGVVVAGTGFTDIFIYPGYKFKVVDGLITNFHLPKSTLIMLVSAFYNKEEILSAYNTAVNEKYKFFSFGDAMLIKG
jgi:S-adenosylmethionine:tRNA ribosyltransferase-isomerase